MRILSTLAVVVVAMTSVGTASAAPIVFSAIGTSPADIQATVDAFRASLGTLNANTPGSVGSGRREINWDGVPDGFSAPNAFPADFFNANVAGRARGVVFSTPGTGFQTSADSSNPTSTPILFNNLLTGPGGEAGSANFQTFSAERLFTAIGSNVTDVAFFVPGSTTAALSRGFGVVFTDTDDGSISITGLEFFGSDGASLGSFLAPANTTNQNLSFLGVGFSDSVVARVRITSGKCAIPTPTGICSEDVVVMDDFIFGEPVAAPAAVPAPASALLLGAALAGLGLTRRRA
ncbi:MAG: PEP-CTERM sorting domain-containing protein [Alphaproteobacteria bacterium]|nr:PEP-CTERM sorting domain-containing protein [Alphaproteobacteria bacterium]